MKTALRLLSLPYLLIALSFSLIAQEEFLPNGNFELGNTNGWELFSSAGNQGFSLNDGSFSGAIGAVCFNNSNLSIDPPISGGFDIISDQSAAGNAGFRRSFIVPDSVLSSMLSWKMRYESVSFFSSPNHELRVQILDESLSLITTIFSASDLIFTTHYSVGEFPIDLTELMKEQQGNTIYIQFEQQNDLGCWPLNIDDISLQIEYVEAESVETASIPTLDQWSIIILFLLLLIISVSALKNLPSTYHYNS